jgi:hypothetical protein
MRDPPCAAILNPPAGNPRAPAPGLDGYGIVYYVTGNPNRDGSPLPDGITPDAKIRELPELRPALERLYPV